MGGLIFKMFKEKHVLPDDAPGRSRGLVAWKSALNINQSTVNCVLIGHDDVGSCSDKNFSKFMQTLADFIFGNEPAGSFIFMKPKPLFEDVSSSEIKIILKYSCARAKLPGLATALVNHQRNIG